MPSAEHAALVEALSSGNPVEAASLEEQRANYSAMLSANPIPDDVTIEPVTVAGCAADWVSTPNSDASRAILYFHGGGYVIGDNVAYREFGGRVARATGARVLVLNYRLAPENPFPAAVDDGVSAFRWIVAQGVKPGNIAISGDSAGGGLTMATLIALRDAGDVLPACGVCYSPWVDLEITGDSARPGAVDDPLVAGQGVQGMAATYAGTDTRNPLASPLLADLAGLPPVQVQVGTREVLLDDSRRLVEKARAAGVEVDYFEGEGLIHVWPVLAPTAPESAAALERMAGFTGKHLG